MDTLTVKLMTPKQMLYSGPAQSVSSTNSAGNFDILNQHANFISIIENHPIIIRTGTQELKFQFSQAIIYAVKNVVTIFAEPHTI